MAKARFSGGAAFLAPSWPGVQVISGTTAPALTQGQAVGSTGANDRLIVVGTVKWDDGGTHDIHQILWRSVTAAPSATLRVGTRTVDTGNGPPARDNGTAGSTNGTHVNPASNTNFTTTFTADDTSVAHGALKAVVWDFSAYTSGSVQVAGAPGDGSLRNPQYPSATYYNGTTYAVYTSAVPMPNLTFVDPTAAHYGTLEGCLPCINAAVATVTYNNTGTNEQGLYLTPNGPISFGKLSAFIRTVAGGDFNFVVYEGTTSKKTVSIDANTWRNDATGSLFDAVFSDYDGTSANDVHLVVAPTSSTNVTIYTIQFSTANEVKLVLGFAGGFGTRAGGAWTNTNTKLPYWFSLGITAVDDGTSSGGILLNGLDRF